MSSSNHLSATWLNLAIFLLIMLAVLVPRLVTASPIIQPNTKLQLDVTYSNGSIVKGPLSFGLASLPSQVFASFALDPIPPAGPGPIPYPNTFRDIDEVISASVSFGNTSWTTSNLTAFEMNTDGFGVLENLAYMFDITGVGIIMNFPLRVIGTEGGQEFEYLYDQYTYSLVQVPEPSVIVLLSLGLAGLGFTRRRHPKALTL